MCKGNYFVPRDPTQPIEETKCKQCKLCGACKQLEFSFDVVGPQPQHREHDVKDSIAVDERPDPLGR